MRWNVILASVLLAHSVVSAAPVDTFDNAQSLPHPNIPPALHWPGALVIGIVGWFAIAAVIGVVVRTNAPPELLPSPSTQEPPTPQSPKPTPSQNEK
jgi:hypothetical protein